MNLTFLYECKVTRKLELVQLFCNQVLELV